MIARMNFFRVLLILLSGFVTSCALSSNPLSPSGGSSIQDGFHPGLPPTSISTTLLVPSVSSIAPPLGVIAGGTSISILGFNFENGATVTIGGNACTAVNFISSTHLTCTTPGHAAGSVSVKVTNPTSLSGTLANAFSYSSGGTPSGFALVSGGGFSSGAGIKLRGTAGAFAGNPVFQSAGAIQSWSGVQSQFVKP